MTTQKEGFNWIAKGIFKGAYDAAGGLAASEYHALLHEADLIARGDLKPGEPFASNRKRARELFEQNYPILAQLMQTEHSKQPPHTFYPPPAGGKGRI